MAEQGSIETSKEATPGNEMGPPKPAGDPSDDTSKSEAEGTPPIPKAFLPSPIVSPQAEADDDSTSPSPPPSHNEADSTAPPAALQDNADSETVASASPKRDAAERSASRDPDQRGNGKLIVETAPPGAMVFIGGSMKTIDTELGETPLEVDLPAATYYLRVEKKGFTDAIAKLAVRPGKENWMRLKLSKGGGQRLKRLRLVGNVLFWPGLAVDGNGIGLIFAGNKKDSPPLAKSGFGLAAAGIVMIVSGGIILGLNYRGKGVYTMPATAKTRDTVEDRCVSVFVSKQF